MDVVLFKCAVIKVRNNLQISNIFPNAQLYSLSEFGRFFVYQLLCFGLSTFFASRITEEKLKCEYEIRIWCNKIGTLNTIASYIVHACNYYRSISVRTFELFFEKLIKH